MAYPTAYTSTVVIPLPSEGPLCGGSPSPSQFPPKGTYRAPPVRGFFFTAIGCAPCQALAPARVVAVARCAAAVLINRDW